jgi:hypothetical protein
MVALGRLKAGEWALLRLEPGITIRWKANRVTPVCRGLPQAVCAAFLGIVVAILLAGALWPTKAGLARQQGHEPVNSIDGDWIAVSVEGAPSARSIPMGLRMGSQVLILGGRFPRDGRANGRWSGLVDGGLYDPDADEWSTIPNAPFAYSASDSAVWTGTEVLFWPDYPGRGHSFDPSAGTWKAIPTEGLGPVFNGHD